MPTEAKKRCSWCKEDLCYQAYHDCEWGIPVYDDKVLFEFLILEGAQAGLSWLTILKKRNNYRKAYDNFEVMKIAAYDAKKREQLCNNAGIIRNKLKIQSSIDNAKVFIAIQKEFGSFSNYIWKYVAGVPILNHFKRIEDIPASTPLSKQISDDLKKRGMRFVGPTIIYAYMQAIGMVNDHLTSCFCHPKNQS